MASPLLAPAAAVAVQEVVLSGACVAPALHRDACGGFVPSCSYARREREVRVLGGAATSCSGAGGAVQWEVLRLTCRSAARVTCLGGGKKRDAARKALEDALGGKKEVIDKWNEEIKKRQEAGGGKRPWWNKGWGGAGGGGGGGGSGKGGGGGRGGEADEIDPDSGNSWEEAKQIAYAFFGLLSLYLILTQGKTMLAIAVNVLFFVLRGFKRSPSYRPPASKTAASTPSLGPLALGNAEADVISKWGKD